MLIATALALLIASGAPAVVVAIVALAVMEPIWFLAAVAVWAGAARWRSRPRRSADIEADLLRGMAAELEAGSSLRAALVAAARRVPVLPLAPAVRMAQAGRPFGEVAELLAPVLPVNGVRVGAALRLAGETGARAADTFSKLAALAAAAAAASREERALTAQARFSAGLIAGAPVVLIAASALAGRALPESWMLAAGGGLLGTGVLSIVVMARRPTQ